ncbi:hypothetical protein IWX47DRAFT_623018 [Phyllosticta citricarpa]
MEIRISQAVEQPDDILSPQVKSNRGDMAGCKGTTRAGKPCKNSGPHQGYCHHHRRDDSTKSSTASPSDVGSENKRATNSGRQRHDNDDDLGVSLLRLSHDDGDDVFGRAGRARQHTKSLAEATRVVAKKPSPSLLPPPLMPNDMFGPPLPSLVSAQADEAVGGGRDLQSFSDNVAAPPLPVPVWATKPRPAAPVAGTESPSGDSHDKTTTASSTIPPVVSATAATTTDTIIPIGTECLSPDSSADDADVEFIILEASDTITDSILAAYHRLNVTAGGCNRRFAYRLLVLQQKISQLLEEESSAPV